MNRHALWLALLPLLASAQGYKSTLTQAANALEDALQATKTSRDRDFECRDKMGPALRRTIDEIDSLRRGANDRRFDDVNQWLTDLSRLPIRCPPEVQRQIAMSTGFLAQARALKEERDERRGEPQPVPVPQPLPPPVPVPQPVPVPVPVAPPPSRNCGTGEDPGCNLNWAGHYAMDRDVFAGFVSSLKGNNSEFNRLDMAKDVLGNTFVTAKQLGVLMDLFNSEFNRLELVKHAAGKLINPQHALGLANKFNSSFNQKEFTRLMTEQKR